MNIHIILACKQHDKTVWFSVFFFVTNAKPAYTNVSVHITGHDII